MRIIRWAECARDCLDSTHAIQQNGEANFCCISIGATNERNVTTKRNEINERTDLNTIFSTSPLYVCVRALFGLSSALTGMCVFVCALLEFGEQMENRYSIFCCLFPHAISMPTPFFALTTMVGMNRAAPVLWMKLNIIFSFWFMHWAGSTYSTHKNRATTGITTCTWFLSRSDFHGINHLIWRHWISWKTYLFIKSWMTADIFFATQFCFFGIERFSSFTTQLWFMWEKTMSISIHQSKYVIFQLVDSIKFELFMNNDTLIKLLVNGSAHNNIIRYSFVLLCVWRSFPNRRCIVHNHTYTKCKFNSISYQRMSRTLLWRLLLWREI